MFVSLDTRVYEFITIVVALDTRVYELLKASIRAWSSNGLSNIHCYALKL
jgi:hypothetical protein